MATRTISNVGGNWNSTGTWVEGAVPTSADAVVATATSGQLTINVTNAECLTFNMTNYVNTLTISSGQQLTCRSTLTLVAGMTIAGTGTLVWGYSSTASTFTTGGQTITGNFTEIGTGAKTLVGDLTIKGLSTWTNTANLTGSGYTIYVDGGWTGTSYFNDTSTNPTVIIRGGTLSGTLPNSQVLCKISPSISDVTFATGTTYQTDIRETTNFVIEASTYNTVHTNAITRFITFTGNVNITDTDFEFNTIQFSSWTGTQLSDIKAVNIMAITGSFGHNGNGYKLLVSGSWISYGVCTWGGTNVVVEMTGTGDYHTITTPSGVSLDSTVTVNCNVIINSTGTITHYGKKISYGNNGIMTYIAGTFDTNVSNVVWGVTTGGYNFDFNTTVPQITFDVAEDVLFLSDFTCTTLNQIQGAGVYVKSGKTLTVGTNMYCNGSTSTTTILGRRDVAFDLVGTRHATFSGGYAQATGINGGNAIQLIAGTGAFPTYQDIGTTFTVAFTVKSASGTTNYVISDDNATFGYIGVTSANNIVVTLQAVTHTIASGVTFNSTTPHRIVVTKASADANPSVYVDGTLLTGGTGSSQAGKILQSVSRIGRALTGTSAIFDEIAIFSDVKDSTWVTADWNSGSLKTYDKTETGIIHLWHFDEAITTDAYLDYNGTHANQKVFVTNFDYIDATGSAVPVYSWHGTATNSTNVYGITGTDIGGGSGGFISITNF